MVAAERKKTEHFLRFAEYNSGKLVVTFDDLVHRHFKAA
jgi:hypothetical protein